MIKSQQNQSKATQRQSKKAITIYACSRRNYGWKLILHVIHTVNTANAFLIFVQRYFMRLLFFVNHQMQRIDVKHIIQDSQIVPLAGACNGIDEEWNPLNRTIAKSTSSAIQRALCTSAAHTRCHKQTNPFHVGQSEK